MPFINLNTEKIDLAGNDFDVVIIGAGAAGIMLAVRLSQAGKKVLMFESGHYEEDESRQKLNDVQQTGKTLANAVWGRKRAIGGTTIAWGGQSLPFSPSDFQKKDWVPLSGWPIDYDAIASYYPIANRFMQVDELDYEDDVFAMLNMDKLKVDKRLLRYHFSKWAPEPNFRKLYEDYLKQNVTLVYNAVVTGINLCGNLADKISVQNFNNNLYSVAVKNLVLATGCIEANRLLLNNNHQVEGGIGNHSGWLGKCFMDHPCISVGHVFTDKPYKLQAAFNTHIYKKRKYSLRLSISDEAQKRLQLLNCSASFMFEFADGKFDPYAELKNFITKRSFFNVKNLFINFRAYMLSAKAYTRDRFFYKHKAQGRLAFMVEQEPQTDSSITISDEIDMFGLPKANIEWKISRKSWDAVISLTEFIEHTLEDSGIAAFKRHDFVNAETKNWEEKLSDVNHHMGGTRMSDDQSTGVVDKNLQIWGYKNVYVCSSSVFCTGSHSNPTLTLLALAARLSDYICNRN